MNLPLRFRVAVMVSLAALAMLVSTLAVAQTETVLYAFPLAPDAQTDGNPYAGPILDAKGNLYGTTVHGGAHYDGSVFKLSPNSNGNWTETDLHSFNAAGQDGVSPYSSLVMDTSGNLYGTTYIGGAYNLGTVFKVQPNADGSWTETVLHSFNDDGTDGFNPYGNLIFDKLGNLYGTTYAGGVRETVRCLNSPPEQVGLGRSRSFLVLITQTARLPGEEWSSTRTETFMAQRSMVAPDKVSPLK
jgi:uncharacterized repeat protein (TIGR03803 family)